VVKQHLTSVAPEVNANHVSFTTGDMAMPVFKKADEEGFRNEVFVGGGPQALKGPQGLAKEIGPTYG